MKKYLSLLTLMTAAAHSGGPVCVPNASTAFTDFDNQAFSVSYDAVGGTQLYRQCTNMSNQQFVNTLNSCSVLANPIDGLGLNPADNFLYGLMPTDDLGIGAHIEFDMFPFPSPGKPGDLMKADPVNVFRIGNDGGYQNIGSIAPPPEDAIQPADTDQVIPIVHTAASFDQLGTLFTLGYKTNYTSSANIIAGTGQVLYQAPEIMIGQTTSAALTAANGGVIPTTWQQADTSADPICAAVMNQFRDRTNTFSECVVADYIANGDQDAALESCLASTAVLDYGIHDFAVSPVNGNYYALDSTSFDTTDVLIEVDSDTMVASCTNYMIGAGATGIPTSFMFSEQNKLVAIFANENTGRWIDVNTGAISTLTDNTIDPYPFGDGASLPFSLPRRSFSNVLGGSGDLIFRNGFEGDLIFANGFEGDVIPPLCPSF